MLVLAMGIVDVLAGLIIYNSSEIGFILALALFLKGAISITSSSVVRTMAA